MQLNSVDTSGLTCLNLNQAMIYLAAGCLVRRACWVDKHLVYNEGNLALSTEHLWTGARRIQTPTVEVVPYINLVTSHRDPTRYQQIIRTTIKMDWEPDMQDRMATDWEVIPE